LARSDALFPAQGRFQDLGVFQEIAAEITIKVCQRHVLGSPSVHLATRSISVNH